MKQKNYPKNGRLNKNVMPYWYLFRHEFCPVCGQEEKWKERKFMPKPKDRKDRYILTFLHCDCEA